MQASDAVALVSIITTGVVAVTLASKDRSQAVWMAERNRQQARLETAYVDLLIFAEEVGMWAQLVLPMLGGDPDRPFDNAPEMPSLRREAEVRARTAAFASEVIREAIDGWHHALLDVRAQVTVVQLRRARASEYAGSSHVAEGWADWTTPWSELETRARPAEAAARETLQRLVAHELRTFASEEPPHPRWRSAVLERILGRQD